MKAYSLMEFLNKPIHTIIENEDDFSFNYKSAINENYIEEGQMISSIKIPIIQRDYAQGRTSNLSLRNEFLKNIFSHLKSRELLKLDFIYGSLERVENEINFLPLDGQQRLTTLFLLHWYVIKKECNKEEQKEKFEKFLSKFTYETRDTSRRFFSNLAGFDFKDNPKTEIEKAYWFSNYFKLDPTVSAVLNTLESIHILYSELEFTLLERLEKIVFYVLPMDQFKLTDDLYIKLNARGKALSSFENFKADIIGFIKKYQRYKQEKDFVSMQLYHYDIISNKFDNKWADFFWHIAKDQEGKKSIDPYLFRFIHKVLINDYIVSFQQKDLLKDDIYVSLLNREEELHYNTFDFYKQRVFMNSVEKIEKLFDFYVGHSSEIFMNIQPLWNADFKWDVFKVSYTMDDRMIFDAVNSYALNNEGFDLPKFKDWMRVVWNIIIDPDNRSIGTNKSAITFIRELAKYSNDILRNLLDGRVDFLLNDSKNNYSLQLSEEKQKAKLLLSGDPNWKELIYEAESYGMLQGNLRVLLNNLSSYSELEKRFDRFKYLFDSNKPKKILEDENYTLMRYVLSSFEDWDELKSFNFTSNVLNWKTYLRKNLNVIVPIQNLLCKCESEIISTVKSALSQSSILQDAEDREKISHYNLYAENEFHTWMQNDGVNKIKWLDHHYFAIRPSAWYSKVMLDNYRNELIKSLINEFKINDFNKHQCGISDYFWGESLEIFKNVNDVTISFYFNNHNELIIGLKTEYNVKSNLYNSTATEELWLKKFHYIYSDINSAIDIDPFIFDITENLIENDPDFLNYLIKS